MTLTPALTEFIQRTGVALQPYIPRGAAEVFALLAVAPGPLSLDEIASALRHSRAGVISSVRILESHEVVDRVTRAGERRDLYVLCDDPFRRVLARVSDRLRDVADVARMAASDAPRLHDMHLTFERASAALDPRRHS
jgi:DNA-binding transcriptional regulator GbsR (MarR family)